MDILCPSWHPWEELPEAIMSDHQMNVTVVKAARAYRFTLQWLISGADDWLMWRQLSCGDNGRIINLVPWWGCRERRCARVCFCVYVGLFDEVKAALVCLPGADEDLSRKGRLCLLLSHTNMQHTHWLCPWRVTLTCTDRFCWGEVSHVSSLRIPNGSSTCLSNCCSSLTHLLHRWLSCWVFSFFLIFSLIPLC